MRKLFGMPEAPWLLGTVVASVFLAATLFLPIWKMELVAPQYPKGLAIYAYGDRLANPSDDYDDMREINGLNHYIGMAPIKEVKEMDLFIPGITLLMVGALAVSFVVWKRRWFRALTIAAFWSVPLFLVADLQYWLYRYGHSMDPSAALNAGSFTPKVFGTTKVWNFQAENSFQVGFYLMLAAAVTISFLPPLLRAVSHRFSTPRGHRQPQRSAGSRTSQVIRA